LCILDDDGLADNCCWMSGRWAEQQPKLASRVELMTSQNAAEGIHNSQQQDLSRMSSADVICDPPLPVSCCTAPHYPAHFTKGSVIQLANGDLKRIEDLSTDDFVRSAEISKDLCIDTSVVQSITPQAERGTVMLEFSVGQRQVQA